MFNTKNRQVYKLVYSLFLVSQFLDRCADHASLGCLKDAEDRDDGLIGLWWFVVSVFGRKLFAFCVPNCSKHENRNKHDDLKVSFTCMKQGSHRYMVDELLKVRRTAIVNKARYIDNKARYERKYADPRNDL